MAMLGGGKTNFREEFAGEFTPVVRLVGQVRNCLLETSSEFCALKYAQGLRIIPRATELQIEFGRAAILGEVLSDAVLLNRFMYGYNPEFYAIREGAEKNSRQSTLRMLLVSKAVNGTHNDYRCDVT